MNLHIASLKAELAARLPLQARIGVVLAAIILAFCVDAWKTFEPVDFTAFICGGSAVRLHLDPYSEQALAGCEQRTLEIFGLSLRAHVTIPAPFPSYALAIFSVFSYLPPFASAVFWFVSIIAAFVISLYLLRDVSGLPMMTIATVLVPAFFMVVLPLGQIVPLIMSATSGTLWALQRNKPRLAACVSLCAMLEPHIGIALCLAVFITAHRARLTMCAGVGIAAAISTMVVPQAVNLEYLHTILPAHALSEVFNDDQYSLTHLLALCGFDPRNALAGGSFEYLLMLFCGAFGSFAIVRRTNDASLAVAFAVLLVLVGGPFIHIQQMSLAAVCGLLIYGRTLRECDAWALGALALPFGAVRTPIEMMLFLVLGGLLSVLLLRVRSFDRGILVAIGTWILAVFSFFLKTGMVSDERFHLRALAFDAKAAAGQAGSFAAPTWQGLILERHSSLGWWNVGFHAILWIAILSLAVSTIITVHHPDASERPLSSA